MSHRINQIVTIWKDVEQHVRRTTIHRQSIPLKGSNLRTAQDAILLWEMALVDLTTPFGSPPAWNLLQHVQYVLKTDLFQLVSMLKDADRFLLQNCVEDLRASYDDFKHHLASKGWLKSGRIIFPLRGLIDEWSLNGDTCTFRLLHTAFVFLLRLSLRDMKDLEDKAMQDYLANESRLLSDGFTTEEAEILAKWFPREGDVRYSPLYSSADFRHGPGATADAGRSLAQKYKMIGSDQWTTFLDNRLSDCQVPRERRPFSRVSRVVFVPKSVSALRTICMEPATLQWYQQGFFKNISRYIDRHWYLKRRISLDNQELNRELAYVGSYDGSYSTIDLSAASDSVSWELVKRWFSHTALREIFWATRSKRAELPDGSIVDLNKFAPMGSALCFPVECLVFAAMAEASIMEVGERPYTSNYRVYGDDIIIETQFANALIKRLETNGFTVNTEKSYTYTNSSLIYRESCGGEYLNGDDVAPVRLSRWFSGLSYTVADASTIERLIDLANDCYGRLPTVRLWVIRVLGTLKPGYKVPFSSDGSKGLYSPNATNHHIKEIRYSSSYQENVYRAGGTKVCYPPNDPDDEDIRLYEYLRLNQTRPRLLFPEDATHVRLTLPDSTKWSSRNHFDLHP